MAFSGFPSAQSTTPAFGGFGGAATTNPGFGGFGAATGTTPSFGAATGTAFGGAPATSSAFGASASGGLFGLAQTSLGQAAAPGFGAPTAQGFGTSVANPSPFGVTQATPAFGAAAPNAFGGAGASTAFGGTGSFGAPTSTAFGAPTSSAAFGGFSSTFAAPTSASGGGLFSSTGTTSGGGIFASPATSTSLGTSSFGGFGTGSTLFNNTQTASAGFGGFGAKPATTQAFAGFNSFQLGQPQQQSSLFANQQFNPLLQQQPAQPQEDPVVTAVMNVNCCGDERDAILSRWNLIQAQWGTGKGFYNQNSSVQFTQQNIFCRFKALGYNLLPGGKDDEGIVSISISKKEAEVRAQQQQILNTLQNLLAGKPMTVSLQEVRGSTNDTTQVLVSVSERTPTGQSKKISATDLANFLNNAKAQLATIAVGSISAVVAPSQEDIQSYLASPPVGIEPRLWHQAQLDNPDPKRYVPVPMIGFGELRSRMACQEAESARHVAFLSQAKGKLEEMQRRAAESKEKLEQRTLSLRNLQRRLMKVLVKFQVLRREGTALLPVEEELRARLEQIKNIVSQPSHCKVRLGELMSQTELRSFMGNNADYLGKYQLDCDSLQELHKYLKMEQEGISHLIDVAGTDSDHIRLMQQGLNQVQQAAIDSSNTALLSRQAQFSSNFNRSK